MMPSPTSNVLARIVTVVTGDGGAISSMAFHASSHRCIHLFSDHVALADWTMTSLTGCFRPGEMNLVAEVHKIRQMIDPNPRYWLAVLIELGEGKALSSLASR